MRWFPIRSSMEKPQLQLQHRHPWTTTHNRLILDIDYGARRCSVSDRSREVSTSERFIGAVIYLNFTVLDITSSSQQLLLCLSRLSHWFCSTTYHRYFVVYGNDHRYYGDGNTRWYLYLSSYGWLLHYCNNMSIFICGHNVWLMIPE